MQHVPVSRLKPGQVVADAVMNAEGAVLCPRGFELTETAIGRIRAAGVQTVSVEGADDIGPSPQERLEQIATRFEGIDDPLMLQIKAAVEKRFALENLDLNP